MVASLATIATTEHVETSMFTKFSSDLDLRMFIMEHGKGSSNKGGAMVSTIEDASYSSTNVQVQGVDESDRVKTDGTHIYLGDGGKVHIIRAGPPMINVTTIDIGPADRSSVEGLYLSDQRLVVIYYEYNPSMNAGAGKAAMYDIMVPDGYVQRTCVKVYDVSDPSAPTLQQSAGMTGYQVTSRMIGTTLYLVTEHSVWSYSDGQVGLPELMVNGSNKDIAATEVSYDPAMPEVSSFVNLLAFDTSSGRVGDLTALTGSTSVIYMSPTALYLTMQLWDSTVVSTSSELTTSIYRIAVDGTDMTLQAQGSITGRPINQFALDEREGRLRIATTVGWTNPSNEVHVLDLDLREVGSVTGIAPGESIYSCRFMGERLYLVTYYQVDPLFVIDLSTDTPAVLGQLKVPGASNYLQMVDAGLMGIGFENGSVKVSLFNVTNPENMIEVGSFVVNGFSSSPAQYDHRAVTYISGKGILAIPVTYYGSGYGTDGSYHLPSSAAVVLELSNDGVIEVGSVMHENATVDRSLYIGEVLFTISDTMVKASSLGTLEPLGSITYGDGRTYYGIDDGIAVPL
ncbi:MAG: beta-propeller domain-containing protein [Methanomassiliicoccus sp.]|nr:beta-propeller domain-containing protein [Methanomassiliicoccus sp.]